MFSSIVLPQDLGQCGRGFVLELGHWVVGFTGLGWLGFTGSVRINYLDEHGGYNKDGEHFHFLRRCCTSSTRRRSVEQ